MASFDPAESIAAKAARPLLTRFASQSSSDELRAKIEKALRERDRQVVVVIDDIDRLSRDQLIAVFQLVSALADFPNTVFVLPFDYDVSRMVLGDVQGIDGAQYLAKIVQIPLVVTRSDSALLRDEVLRLLEDTLGDIADDDAVQINREFGGVAACYLRNLRDVKRLVNVFETYCDSIAEELNIADLLTIAALQSFDPDLYYFIASNRKLLCEFEYVPSDKHGEFAERVAEELRVISGSDDEFFNRRQDILRMLFPKVASSAMSYKSDEMKRRRRVGSEEYFSAYFSFRREEVPILASDLAKLVHGAPESAAILAEACAERRLAPAISAMSAHISTMSAEAAVSLFAALFPQLGKSSESARGLFLRIGVDDEIVRALKFLLGGLGQQQADAVFLSSLERADLDHLAAVSHFMNSLELAHGRLAADEPDGGKQLISIAALVRAEEVFREKVSGFTSLPNVFLSKGADLHMLLNL